MTSEDGVKEQLQNEILKNTVLNLDQFASLEDVCLYVDAIVSSGSSEEANGCVFVLGNTSVGKSSLVQNLRNYCKDLSEAPQPVLTGAAENKTLLETRVLDLVENVQLQRKTKPTLDTSTESSSSKLGIITLADNTKHKNKTDETVLEKIKTSFVDFGGHTEYASCSPIFLKDKGVFLICFLSSKFQNESTLEKEFFPSIGTYLQLAMENCDTPIIFLVATKADQLDGSSTNSNFSSVLRTAKEQLETFSKRSEIKKPFIFNHVFQISLERSHSVSNANLKDLLDELMSNLVAVFGHSSLMNVKLKAVPKSWRKMVNHWKSYLQQVTIAEAVADYKRIIERDRLWMNRAQEEEIPEDLDEWKTAADQLVTFGMEKESLRDQDQESPTEDSDLISPAPLPVAVTRPVETKETDATEEVSNARKCIEGFLSCFSKRAPAGEKDHKESHPLQPLAQKSDQPAKEKDEDRRQVEGMLTFFSSDNEILWFR